jgi:thymidylate synthase (FAD)
MTGSIRSWIHFLQIRDDAHAQKEIQLIAKAIKAVFLKQLPVTSTALGLDKPSCTSSN